jgi:membrane-associated HD superfamily phosphohydrolase
VEASPYARDIGVHTVGLFHKALTVQQAPGWIPHAVFFIGFVLGLPIIIQIVRSTYARIRAGQRDLLLLLDLSILLFLIVMPFSYLNWEKYLMPLVPLAAIRMAALRLPVATEVE